MVQFLDDAIDSLQNSILVRSIEDSDVYSPKEKQILLSLAEKHSDRLEDIAMKEDGLSTQNKGGEAFARHMKDPEFKSDVVDIAMQNPSDLQSLLTKMELNDPDLTQALEALNTPAIQTLSANNPEQIKNILMSDDRPAAFQETWEKDRAFRNSVVDGVLDNPNAIQTLSTQFSLNDDPNMENVTQMLDDPKLMALASQNKAMAYELADPANKGKSLAIINKYNPTVAGHLIQSTVSNPKAMAALLKGKDPKLQKLLQNEFVQDVMSKNPQITIALENITDLEDAKKALTAQISTPQVQKSIIASINAHPNSARAANKIIQNEELGKLIALPTVQRQQIANSVATGASIQQAAANARLDALIKTSGEKPLLGGQEFMDLIPQALGKAQDSDVLQSVNALKADSDLMEAIGKDIAKNGKTLKTTLPKIIDGGDPKAMNAFIEEHPAMAKAIMPVFATANPAGLSQMLKDNTKTSLLKGLKGAEKAEMENLLQNAEKVRFFDKLAIRMGDPKNAANIMDNLQSMQGSGSSFISQFALKKIEEDPDSVADLLAGEMFMAKAMERWGTEFTNFSIDKAFDGFSNVLAQFGIDPHALDGFKERLKGFIGPKIAQLGGTMQNYQLAQKVSVGVNENLADMGINATGMNSTGGGLFGGLTRSLGNIQRRADLAYHIRATGGDPDQWVENQIAFETDVAAQRHADQVAGIKHDAHVVAYVDSKTAQPLENVPESLGTGPNTPPPKSPTKFNIKQIGATEQIIV